MIDRLEHYYASELQYLADAGREFALQHPQEAALLHPDNIQSRDPHVERLFENFAFLTGSLRAKLDAELPELSESLLSLLAPHYMRPVPAMVTVQLNPDFVQLTQPATIDAGEYVRSVPIRIPATATDVTCDFRTCYPVELYPAELTDARLHGPVEGRHAIQLTMAVRGNTPWEEVGATSLRFFLHGEAFQLVYSLYYHLHHAVDRVEARGDAQSEPVACTLSELGFDRDDEVIPYAIHSFPGFRLLHEYFCFPEKFLYIDIGGIDRLPQGSVSREFTVTIWLRSEAPPWWRISAANFRQFCTPAINLYQEHTFPILFDQRKTEYPIYVDRSAPEAYQVHSVLSVTGRPSGESASESKVYESFHEFRHNRSEDEAYYHCATRRTVQGMLEQSIALLLPDGAPAMLPEQVLSLDVECFNGDLPRQLRPGDIRYRGDGMSHLVSSVTNLASPTAVRWPVTGHAAQWRLISHLGLNSLSLADPGALVGILRLYEWTGSAENQRRIEGLQEVTLGSERALLIRNGLVLHGLNVECVLDDRCFTDPGDAYLFSQIVRHFSALYASINSFVRLRVRRASMREVWEWPALDGRQMIV